MTCIRQLIVATAFVFAVGLVLLSTKVNPGVTTVTRQQTLASSQVISDHTNRGRVPLHENSQKIEPMIYFVTPTYPRPEQRPDLTRLANTLMHIPYLHWLVADDSKAVNRDLIEFLNLTGLNYTYILSPKPKTKKQGRGVSGRIASIDWLKQNNITEGVLYFGDDDNTYDLRIFDEMRYTKKVAMWPVGLVTAFGVSTPIVKDGKVTGFYDGWIGGRKFPVDMAGFAVGIPFLFKAKRINIPYVAGYIETKFLESLGIKKEDIEVKADNCTKIYVWHTQTKKNQKAKAIDYDKWKGKGTNLEHIAQLLV